MIRTLNWIQNLNQILLIINSELISLIPCKMQATLAVNLKSQMTNSIHLLVFILTKFLIVFAKTTLILMVIIPTQIMML